MIDSYNSGVARKGGGLGAPVIRSQMIFFCYNLIIQVVKKM